MADDIPHGVVGGGEFLDPRSKAEEVVRSDNAKVVLVTPVTEAGAVFAEGEDREGVAVRDFFPGEIIDRGWGDAGPEIAISIVIIIVEGCAVR